MGFPVWMKVPSKLFSVEFQDIEMQKSQNYWAFLLNSVYTSDMV